MNHQSESVVREVGSGSYSLVYHVKSPGGKTDLALKLNFCEKDHDGIGSYNELQSNLELENYFIMKIRDIREGDFTRGFHLPNDKKYCPDIRPDNLHFIYPLAESDLFEFMVKNRDNITYKFALKIILEVSLALEYVHAKGYVHRDLKPQNILVKIANGEYHFHLSDFGSAKYYLEYDTHSPYVTTANYRAPELVLGYKHYNKSIDVWALGCIMYELFTGNLLFCVKKGTTAELLSVIKEKYPYNIPRDYVKNINSSFVDYFSKAFFFQNSITFTPCITKTCSLEDKICFSSLLKNTLCFDHTKRITMTQIVDFPIFNSEKVLISWSRKNFPPVENPYPIIRVTKSKERARMISLIRDIYKNQDLHPWYKTRILFLTIYNFDRLPEDIFKRYNVDIVFYTILYLSVKVYKSSGMKKYSIYDILPNGSKSAENLNKAVEIESLCVREYFQFRIRIDTIYDYSLKKECIKSKEISSMLEFVFSCMHENITSSIAYIKWKRSLK